MKQLLVIASSILLFSLLITGCTTGSSPCSETNPCKQGHACDKDGVCIEAVSLAITTESLPAAHLDRPYGPTVTAVGGLGDYSWSLSSSFTWLEIDSSSGELYGTPAAVSSGTTVTVSVTDSSFGSGQTVSKDFELVIHECVELSVQACYFSQSGQCFAGTQTCHLGKWAVCEGSLLSIVTDHCGPGCTSCDPATANNCNGTCRCGPTPQCSAGSTCCDSSCIDLASPDLNNCGACGVDCESLVDNVTQAVCQESAGGLLCDYSACLDEWLDCDGDRKNGCETPKDIDNCGQCGVDCLAEPSAEQDKVCVFDETSADKFRCGCESYLDCNIELGQICCDQQCYPIDDPAHCGGCANDCLAAMTNLACLFDANQTLYYCGCENDNHCRAEEICCDNQCVSALADDHCGACDVNCTLLADFPVCMPDTLTCGCLEHDDCGTTRLCCNDQCIDRDDDNCIECDQACSIGLGGPHCNAGEHVCTCQGDQECGILFGGLQSCIFLPPFDLSMCLCGVADSCDGGPESQCCPDGQGGLECVNLLTDNDNCGRCGVECGDFAICQYGICPCRDETPAVDCPVDGPAPDCVTDHGGEEHCVCSSFQIGILACPDQRVCCAGNSGGSGGPDDTADSGCCQNPCGDNVAGECLFE
ncbi:MAG: hypothetical protein JRJ87_14115 [Deltaproteobacteria bacterium]|nr:hypothetical protein [Deltaproteobacteria bacterium]